DSALVGVVNVNDSDETFPQVGEVVGETQDRHDLGGHHAHETALTRHAVGAAAESDDDLAQRPIVDIDHAGPADAAHVETELIALVDVVVDESGQQVVGERDGGKVGGEMQVDGLHRHQLRVAAAGRAPLHAEHRSQ